VPGAALVELAVQGGDRTGTPVIEELLIETPLTLTEGETRALQVVVGAVGPEDTRPVTLHSKGEHDPHWTRHATGTLTSRTAPTPPHEPGPWPPADAERLADGDFYAELSRAGYEYGPAFQGVRALWRRGEELFAEVVSPGGTGFAVHPALLDAALHPLALAVARGDGPVELPFVWRWVELRPSGEETVRVRLTPGPDGARVTVGEPGGGAPVATIGSLVSRPVPLAAEDVFGVEWVPVPLDPGGSPLPALTAGEGLRPGWCVLRVPPGHGDDARRARDAVTGVLAAVQRVLADSADSTSNTDNTDNTDSAGQETRLVITTEDAEGAEGADDPAMAAVWGLVRSAQAEHPGRFLLVRGGEPTDRAVEALAAAGEWQIALRDGRAFAPRLTRISPAPNADATGRGSLAFGPTGTVVITGGTGTLGALTARHLVTRHGVRHLVLLSRQGESAPGAGALREELVRAGADVRVVACDVADPVRMRELTAGLAEPLAAVVHTAGALDDGVITALDGERFERVFRPKVDAVEALDALTREAGAALVLFSSAAGLLGHAGQGNYAAANAFLDAVAARRHAAGFPAVSLAWGLWEEASALTGHLTADDTGRMARDGIAPIDSEQGMRMLDAALAGGRAVVAPVAVDRAGLRTAVREGRLAPVWRTIAGPAGPAPRETARAALPADLAAQDPGSQLGVLTGLVRREAALVLGRSGTGGIGPTKAFREIGFDSLTSVELRNRLTAATGVRLPVTVVFDHPNATALATRLRTALFPVDEPGEPGSARGAAPATTATPAAPGRAPDDDTAAIAEMDAEELIKRALGELG
ncbi:type I polyketide synthase, partial [Streptomyces sp. NPDC057638]|uniref:type I polyketide synthase n=1 Tax=Streptomyces sp. NPDC057638 TaxID=3346190 RepID=UPI00368304B5